MKKTLFLCALCMLSLLFKVAASSITGVPQICEGTSATYTIDTTGGFWISSATGVATVGSSTGIVMGQGVSVPTPCTISYKIGASVIAAITITVNVAPTNIGRFRNICIATERYLTNTVPGGVWSSSNTAAVTIGSATGVMTGVSAGSTVVTYQLSNGCYKTAPVTVYPSVSGGSMTTGSVCTGSTIALSITGGTAGGSWSSNDLDIATVGSTGIATGTNTFSAPKTVTIEYIKSSTCISGIVTVDPFPVITGTASVCIAATTTLSSAAGGSWSSDNTGIATVGSTGIVSGVSNDQVNITYTMPAGCFATKNVTVHILPDIASSSGTTICNGATTTMYGAPYGGIWSSSSSSIISVGTTDGEATATATGTATGSAVLTYTASSGCISTMIVTVQTSPGTITGTLNICPYTSASLSCGISGGTWSSDSEPIIDTATGAINTTPFVIYANAPAREVTFTYTLSNGCYASVVATLNPDPYLEGYDQLCQGQDRLGYNALVAGGTWSSSNTAIATAGSISPIYGGPAEGSVFGVSPGVATITYTIPTGCISTKAVTVQPTPGTITGNLSICQGVYSQLTVDLSGGEWQESSGYFYFSGDGLIYNPSYSTPGSTSVTYTIYYGDLGCTSPTAVVTSYAVPPITGTTSVCEGSTTLLSNSTSGGTWSSSNASIATVGTAGLVAGVDAGTAQITYTLGCSQIATVTVNECGGRPEGSEYAGLTDGSLHYLLSPNPNNGNLIIQQNIADDNPVQIKVVNLLGAIVHNCTHKFSGGQTNLSLTNATSGMYLVQLTDSAGLVSTFKMTIER